MNQNPFDEYDIAEDIKRCYISRTQLRGGSFRFFAAKPKHDVFWLAAARLCIREGFDPDAHVRALFASSKRTFPNMLVGDIAVERTRRFTASEADEELIRFKSQLARLRGCVNVGENVKRVLTNPEENFTPAFICCMATTLGLSDVASFYKDDARRELLVHPKMYNVLVRFSEGKFAEVLDNGCNGGAASHSAGSSSP